MRNASLLKRLALAISQGLLVLLTAVSADAFPLQPIAGQESFFTRATFADGRLWLLTDAGELSSIARESAEQRAERMPDPVFDLCAQDGHPVVATGKRLSAPEWTLRQYGGSAWSATKIIPTQGDDLVAMECDAGGITLLTTHRVVVVEQNGKQSAIVLSDSLDEVAVTSMHTVGDQIFVGINRGEWGGGLRRIDRRSGQITTIERKGPSCYGPLNSECDPVNGIASEPWKPGCIAVAIGLVHFEPHGRVVEVCGNEVKPLYYAPYGEAGRRDHAKYGGEPWSTVAFFGLVTQGDALYAAGIDGVYRIEKNGTARVTPLPHFNKIGSAYVSFDLPHLILVLTDVNQRRSISGSTPLLVAY
jgi:hypothetical protein